jgi:hypothetical protein
MLDICFREDQLDLAGRYARDLLAHQPEQPVTAEEMDLRPYLEGAHFVLARLALRKVPPQPDETLEHVRAAEELQQRWAAQARGAGEGTSPAADPRPRWRMIHLEAQALAVKADAAGPAPGAGKPSSSTEGRQAGNTEVRPAGARDAFQARLTSGLQRVREDLKPVPGHAPDFPQEAVSPLVRLPGTDLRGLLDFLTLAVERSPDRGQTVERTALLLTTWETLAGTPRASAAARREVVARFSQWPKSIKLPADVALQPADWLAIYPRLEALIGRLIEAGGADPAQCLDLARDAHQRGHFDAGLRLARLGLLSSSTKDRQAGDSKGAQAGSSKGGQAAQTQQAPGATAKDPADRVVLALHAEAAWLNLLLDHTADAAEHLAVLRAHPKHFPGLVQLLDGMTALDNGLPERAAAQFQQARLSAEYSHSIYPHLGLAQAYLALGAYEQALASLEKLEQSSGKQRRQAEERLVAEQLTLGPVMVSLELFRCHLALGDRARALQYRESLRGEPEWLTATVLLLHQDLDAARSAGRPEDRKAREALAAARQDLTEARQVERRDEPRLLLLEAELLSLTEDRAKAEQLLRAAVAAQGKPDETSLVWACWLLHHGRVEEAGQVLDDLEKAAPAALKSRLPVLRAAWRLAQAPALKDAGQLLEVLGLPAGTANADLYLVARDNPPSRYESTGVRHFWRGLTAHAAGDLATATRAYAGAASLALLRSQTRPYFLAAVRQLDRQNAPAANDILVELLQERPPEPVQVLASVETALLLDNIQGDQGVEKALANLEALLRTQGQEPAAGPWYQARTWLAASRPDKAREALDRALKSNPAYRPGLMLAGPVARANQDWPALLSAAAALEKVSSSSTEGRQAGAPEVLVWRAEALARQDQDAQAEKAYRDLLDKRLDQAEAYQGLVALKEKGGDYDGALTWVARWHQALKAGRPERQPSDLRALEAEVRVLAGAGRETQAAEAAEKATTSTAGRQAGEREAEAALAAARGFLAARSLDLALTWAKRAEATARNKPEAPAKGADRPDSVGTQARLLLGDVLQVQAQAAREPARRKALVKEAIESYRAVYQEVPGHPHAGRCLALLLARDEGEGDAAFAIAQRLRQGRYSQGLITGDRLPLDLLDTLGIVYRVSRHRREAVALFRDAAERYPREPMVLFRLGQAQAAIGLKGEATGNLTRAVQLAEEKLPKVRDPEEKARLQELRDQARRSLQ